MECRRRRNRFCPNQSFDLVEQPKGDELKVEDRGENVFALGSRRGELAQDGSLQRRKLERHAVELSAIVGCERSGLVEHDAQAARDGRDQLVETIAQVDVSKPWVRHQLNTLLEQRRIHPLRPGLLASRLEIGFVA
jgi:hypothetical protein